MAFLEEMSIGSRERALCCTVLLIMGRIFGQD